MKFLDSTGLAHFLNKIKEWCNSIFFSKKGGEITPTSGLHYIINGKQLNVSKSGGEKETIDIFTVDENGMSAINIVKTGGTATQVLMANGSVKTLNASNGIAGLDSKGNVPLSQLGNLDTTVAEVVTALPTTNIKKHIYLIKDTGGVTQNQYEEYIYTGNTSATYDASKWEKLGDFRATVDLADYAKKNKAVSSLRFVSEENQVKFSLLNIDEGEINSIYLGQASKLRAGVMTASDKSKLDGIASNANNYSLPTASSTIKGGITLGYSQNGKNYPVAIDSNGKAYVNVPWTDTNTKYSLATSTNDGLMSKADKVKIDGIDTTYAKKNEAISIVTFEQRGSDLFLVVTGADKVSSSDVVPLVSTSTNGVMDKGDKIKLDSIASGATADSAITTAEIDALFA